MRFLAPVFALPVPALLLVAGFAFSVTVAVPFSGGAEDGISAGGVRFSVEVDVAGSSTPFRGAATFRHWGFRVFTAALYVPDAVRSEAAFWNPETPKRLVLHYHRSIKKSDIIRSSQALIRKNPEIDQAALADRLEQAYAMYADVEAGDRFAITWIPGEGTRIALNDRDRGLIEGADFAEAFLGMWLSRHGMDAAMARVLMGLDESVR